MIRKLNEDDRNSALKFLYREASINLFIIGDIENHGFEKDFMTIWGSFDEENKLKGVFLKYYENYIAYYDRFDSDVECFKNIIRCNDCRNKVISGKSSIIEDFKDVFKEFEIKETSFCELKDESGLKGYDDSIKVATENDSKRICDFVNGIKEFRDISGASEEQFLENMRSKSGRTYYIENEKKDIIANVQTTAENSKSGMIVAVATKEEYRNRGLVTKCLSKLCKDMLKEGKTLCLFYDNPIAGKLYKKLGFKDIDKWTMIIEK